MRTMSRKDEVLKAAKERLSDFRTDERRKHIKNLAPKMKLEDKGVVSTLIQRYCN